MSGTIRIVYNEEPKFPAIDQHPDAVRYKVGTQWVDAIGGKPTQGEIDEFLEPAAKVSRDEEIATLTADLAAETITLANLRRLLKLERGL